MVLLKAEKQPPKDWGTWPNHLDPDFPPSPSKEGILAFWSSDVPGTVTTPY